MVKEPQSRPLYGIFTDIPPHYDLVNRIITMGLDRRWREAAVRACLALSPQRALDIGCGTGDFAITIARMAKRQMEIIGLDYSEPMLEIAREKARQVSGNKVTFVNGDAIKLPFPDEYFDCVGISFAFRNLTYRNPLTKKALTEIVRVLKPAGRFVAVESSQPKSAFVRFFFRLYLKIFVAHMGYLVSGNRGAYHYLAESAARFHTPQEIKELLMCCGFSEVAYQPLLLGAAGVHVATK
ncbi:bifunctional demethylmenaquinone methyltransferase/2-methoxy-6-polyprenyl-1,4-benzoquinol methylase UbiE [Chloroflexota bacterium]